MNLSCDGYYTCLAGKDLEYQYGDIMLFTTLQQIQSEAHKIPILAIAKNRDDALSSKFTNRKFNTTADCKQPGALQSHHPRLLLRK